MEMLIKILKTPNIPKREYQKFKTDDPILQEIVDNFTFVLERELSQENLQLFYNNISTLKIDYESILSGLKSSLSKSNIVVGYYFLMENIISVLPLGKKKYWGKYINVSIEEYIVNICHELLHMSSTIIDSENKVSFSGLSQVSDETPIGLAIDDAYTELLLYRYFNLNKAYMSYDYEIIITSLIEEIISKNKMTNLYFTANLYGLVEELKKYNTKENILKFLEDLDSIYALRDYSRGYKKDIIYYHNEISYFIVSTYQNKLKRDLEEGRITQGIYDTKLDHCTKNISAAFNKLKVTNSKKIIRRNHS